MLRIRDVMRSDFTSLPSCTPILEVARQIEVSGMGFIPICDNGKFRGMVTEKDIVSRITAPGTDRFAEHASSMMNNQLPFLSPDDDILRAADVMAHNNARVLPVVHNGKLVGLLSLDDLAREHPPLAAMIFCRTAKSQTCSSK